MLSTLVICGDNRLDEFNFFTGPKNNVETNPVGYWPWMASLGFFDDDSAPQLKYKEPHCVPRAAHKMKGAAASKNAIQ